MRRTDLKRRDVEDDEGRPMLPRFVEKETEINNKVGDCQIGCDAMRGLWVEIHAGNCCPDAQRVD